MSLTATKSRIWLAMVALVPATIVVGLDITILSVALPTLADKLSASTAQLQWFVMAYTITFAAAIIPSGILSDRFGRRRVLMISLVVFGLGSLACVFSQNSGELVAARALLGVGAAGIATLSIVLVTVMFPEERRGRAMTTIIMANMVGYPLGPIFGGWLLAHVGWQWLFVINLPIVVIALVIGRLAIPESRAETAQRLDLPGLLTVTGAVVLLCFGFTQAGSHTWSEWDTWLPIAGGAVLLIAFLAIEARSTAPMVPLSLFRRLRFTSGALGASLLSFVVAGLLFFIPQYTQTVLGATTEQSGLYLVAFVVGMFLVSPFSGRLVRVMGGQATIAIGFTIGAVAMIMAVSSTVSSPGWWLVSWSLLVGIAFGLGLPTSMDLALGDLGGEEAGVGSAVLQSLRQVSTAMGAAIIGGVLASGYRGHLHVDLPVRLQSLVHAGVVQGLAVATKLGSPDLAARVREAFMVGMRHASLVCAVICAIAVVVFVVLSIVARARRRVTGAG